MTAKNLTRRVVIAAPVAIAMLALGIFLLSGGGEDRLHSPAGENPPQPAAPEQPQGAPSPGEPGKQESTPETASETAGREGETLPPAPAAQKEEEAASSPGGLLALQLLDVDGEVPVSRSEFNLRVQGATKTRNLQIKTDDQGYALLDDLEAGEYPALLRHQYYLADRRVLDIPKGKPGEKPEVVRILLQRGETLLGEVTDLRGKPVQAARVTLAFNTPDGPLRHQVSTREDGSFSFGALLPGDWKLAVFHSSYRAGGPLTVRIPASKDLSIKLVDSSGLNVFVQSPDGNPCEGARVSARVINAPAGAIPSPSIRTNAQGLASLQNLPGNPGTLLTVTAMDARYPALSRKVTVDELEGGSFVMRFPAPRSIEGIVLNTEGNTVANARVSLTGPRKLFVRSTSSGAFRFKKVPPGEYHLQASLAAEGISKRLLADTEENSLSDLELVLEAGAGPISGKIQDSRGRPLALVPLRLTAEGLSIETVSSPTGVFSFAQLPDGSYTLRAGDSRRGQGQRTGIRPPAVDIVFTIERPGSLRGILRTDGPVRGYSLRLEERAGAGARGIPAHTWHFSSQVGRFHLRDLAPGVYDLLLLSKGAVTGRVKGVTIRAGEETGPISISPGD